MKVFGVNLFVGFIKDKFGIPVHKFEKIHSENFLAEGFEIH